MRRRKFIALLGGSAVAWPLAALAQQPAKPWRIGFLFPRSASDIYSFDEFRRGMQDLGYVERKDFVIEPRYADGQYERLAGLAEELVRMKVDVILAVASPAIRAAQRATQTIPIVMSATGDPIASGLVTNLARPGGNTTGMSLLSPDIGTKHLELLTMLVPKISRVALLLNPGSSTRTSILKAIETAGQSAGIAVLPIDAGTAEEVDRGFAELKQARAEAVVVAADAFLIGEGRHIAELATQYRLPSIFEIRESVKSGGLMSYGPSVGAIYRRAASYVNKILKGAKPGDIPVEQPTKFELVINLKTAKALGLEIPPTLLALADEVIE
jgi:putative tryptophan/tyrosine transport system substrate-binding protein